MPRIKEFPFFFEKIDQHTSQSAAGILEIIISVIFASTEILPKITSVVFNSTMVCGAG